MSEKVACVVRRVYDRGALIARESSFKHGGQVYFASNDDSGSLILERGHPLLAILEPPEEIDGKGRALEVVINGGMVSPKPQKGRIIEFDTESRWGMIERVNKRGKSTMDLRFYIDAASGTLHQTLLRGEIPDDLVLYRNNKVDEEGIRAVNITEIEREYAGVIDYVDPQGFALLNVEHGPKIIDERVRLDEPQVYCKYSGFVEGQRFDFNLRVKKGKAIEAKFCEQILGCVIHYDDRKWGRIIPAEGKGGVYQGKEVDFQLHNVKEYKEPDIGQPAMVEISKGKDGKPKGFNILLRDDVDVPGIEMELEGVVDYVNGDQGWGFIKNKPNNIYFHATNYFDGSQWAFGDNPPTEGMEVAYNTMIGYDKKRGFSRTAFNVRPKGQ